MIHKILFFILSFVLLSSFIVPDRGKDGENIVQTAAFANAQKFRFRGLGISQRVSGSMPTNIDHILSEERAINGIQLILKFHCFGDTVKFQVVHPVAGVLDEFGSNWNIAEDKQDQGHIMVPYPANVPKDLILRLVYNSTCMSDVEVRINYFLHKKDF